MVRWLQWLSALAVAIAAFLQQHPTPRRVRAAYVVPAQVAQAAPAAPAAPAEMTPFRNPVIPSSTNEIPAPDIVVDTQQVKECDGRQCWLVTYHWKRRATEPGRLLLFRGNVQIGGWNVQHRLYLEYNAAYDRWGTQRQDCPPVPVPEPKPEEPCGWSFQQAPGPPPADGVNHEKLKEFGPAHLKGEKRITREQSFEALADAAKALPGDADALRVTCTGPGCNGKKLLADVLAGSGRLAEWKNKLSVQCYDSAEDPMLRGLGFAASGVQVQAPGGRPLWFCASYDGPEQLAEGLQLAQAREKDPNWDPNNWPKMNAAAGPAPPTPAPTPEPAPDDHTPWWKPFAAIVATWALRELLPYLKTAIANALAKKPLAVPEFTPEQWAAIAKRLDDAKKGQAA